MKAHELERKAKWIRSMVLEAILRANKGHIGGTYSCIELLVGLYYGKFVRPGKDKFILGKGHACTALYAIFLDLGIMSRKTYDTYGKDGGLGGQLHAYLPGVDFNTGSMGHAIGVAAGMVYAGRLDRKNIRAVVMIGDAELFEGSCWEAIIFAGQLRLRNLIVIIDRNRLSVMEVINDDGLYKDFKKKIESFGWTYLNINGHDFHDIQRAFQKAQHSAKPVMIIADTVKGKGVSFMENNVAWHNALPSPEQIAAARRELI